MALSLLYAISMKQHRPMTPEQLSRTIEKYFAERQAEILPSGEQTKDGKRLSWCGDVLEYLTEDWLSVWLRRALPLTRHSPDPSD